MKHRSCLYFHFQNCIQSGHGEGDPLAGRKEGPRHERGGQGQEGQPGVRRLLHGPPHQDRRETQLSVRGRHRARERTQVRELHAIANTRVGAT